MEGTMSEKTKSIRDCSPAELEEIFQTAAKFAKMIEDVWAKYGPTEELNKLKL